MTRPFSEKDTYARTVLILGADERSILQNDNNATGQVVKRIIVEKSSPSVDDLSMMLEWRIS